VTILTAPSPLISGRSEGPYELTPSIVPVRTFFCRSRTHYLLNCGFPAFSAGGLGNCRNHGAILAPAELSTIHPATTVSPPWASLTCA